MSLSHMHKDGEHTIETPEAAKLERITQALFMLGSVCEKNGCELEFEQSLVSAMIHMLSYYVPESRTRLLNNIGEGAAHACEANGIKPTKSIGVCSGPVSFKMSDSPEERVAKVGKVLEGLRQQTAQYDAGPMMYTDPSIKH